MGSAIFKQPNGLLGTYSYVSDGFSRYNMTKEESIISDIETTILRELNNLERKNYYTNYNSVIKDARNYIKECIRNTKDDKDLTEEEREEDIERYKEKSEENEKLIKMMETTDSIVYEEQEYYKTVYELIIRLCCFYDKNWEPKNYQITDEKHREDMLMIISKLKETTELFDAYANLSKKTKRK